jgi:hypothetical protein
MQKHNTAGEKWAVKFRVNGDPINWRERIGNALRSTAQRIDQRFSLGISIESMPLMTNEQKKECITIGIREMQNAAFQQGRLLALDKYFKRTHPSLHVTEYRGD